MAPASFDDFENAADGFPVSPHGQPEGDEGTVAGPLLLFSGRAFCLCSGRLPRTFTLGLLSVILAPKQISLARTWT